MTEGAGRGPAPGGGPSIADMLDRSAVAPLLHMPVGDILRMLRVPPPPQLPPMPPLPSLPPLPTVDVASLFKPLTDLRAGFGSGDMASLPFDPTKIFDGLMQAFQTVTSLGSQAMSALSPLWTGPAATSALAKGAEANVNGTRTGAQSGDISRIVAVATASVAKGVAALEAVIAEFAATVTALIPVAWTPAGQAGIIASASAHLSAGLGVVAETRAEIMAHTANMSITGMPVAITAVPQVAAQVPGLAMTSVQTVAQPIESVVSSMSGRAGATPGRSGVAPGVRAAGDGVTAGREGPSAARSEGSGMVGEMGGGGLRGGGAVGGVGTGAQPMGQRAAESFGNQAGRPGVGSGGIRAGDSDETVSRRSTTSTTSTSAVPMGAGMGASPSASSHTTDREHSVDARHTDDVVGEVPTASPSVLGEAEPMARDSMWGSTTDVKD